MKLTRLPHLLAVLVAAFCVAAPSSSYADRKIKVRRDLDGDGHYNTKTIRVGDRHHHRGYSGHRGDYRGGYGGSYYGGRSYYGRPYSYGYRPSYGYSSYSYGPSIALSYAEPGTYYRQETVYTGRPAASAHGSLAVEVQAALKRRGYYRGSLDGIIGSGSRSAIRRYQAERGIPVTGRIDSNLLRALDIG